MACWVFNEFNSIRVGSLRLVNSCACMHSNPSDMAVCCVAAIRGTTAHTGKTTNESGWLKRENGPIVGKSLLKYYWNFIIVKSFNIKAAMFRVSVCMPLRLQRSGKRNKIFQFHFHRLKRRSCIQEILKHYSEYCLASKNKSRVRWVKQVQNLLQFSVQCF